MLRYKSLFLQGVCLLLVVIIAVGWIPRVYRYRYNNVRYNGGVLKGIVNLPGHIHRRELLISARFANPESFPLENGLDKTQIKIRKIEDEIDSVGEQIVALGEDIKKVEVKIDDVERQIQQTLRNLDDPSFPIEKRDIQNKLLTSLLDEKNILRNKEKSLLDKENILRNEKKSLLDKDVAVPNSFFSALEGAKLHGRILRLSSDEKFELFSPEIYVRDCWIKMYQIMEESLKKGCKHIVVTGSPGIGKSQFLQYCMWRLAKQGESFLHETEPGMVNQYSPGTMASHSYFHLPSGIPYLVDLKEPKLPCVNYGNWVPRFTAIFSSPNPLRFKEILKIPNSIELIMPPWDEEEIYDAHRLMSKFQSVDINVVSSQFLIYGGVPRYVFEQSDEGYDYMEMALKNKGLAVARSGFLSDMSGGVNEALSYALCHLRPKYENTFKFAYTAPASTFVVEALMAKHQERLMENALRSIQSKDNPGFLFEYIVSRYALAGHTHNASRLSVSNKDSAPALEAMHRNLTIGSFEKFPLDWKNSAWTPKSNVLYFPNTMNLQSIDAFTIIGRELVFFQCTVSSQHSVKTNGLMDIFKLFSKSEGAGLIDKCSLIFVVPTESDLNKVQPLMSKSDETKAYKKSASIPNEIKHLETEQYVVRIDLRKMAYKRRNKERITKR